MKNFTNKNKGFSLVELIVTISIMSALTGILTPTLIQHIEKGREATDLTNVSNARSEVIAAATISDSNAKYNGKTMKQSDGSYVAVVDLKQVSEGWQSSTPIRISEVSYYGVETANWIGEPGSNGTCTITYYPASCNTVYTWAGGTAKKAAKIDKSTLNKLTDTIAELSKKYSFSSKFINSHELDPNGQTAHLLSGLDKDMSFENMGAKSWSIYNHTNANNDIEQDIIYWSTLDIKEVCDSRNVSIGNNQYTEFTIPIMGYNPATDSYDVYAKRIVQYSDKTGGSYYSIEKIAVSKSTFEFDYDTAQKAYNDLMAIYNEKGTISGTVNNVLINLGYQSK